jgi:hypothetical protein
VIAASLMREVGLLAEIVTEVDEDGDETTVLIGTMAIGTR